MSTSFAKNVPADSCVAFTDEFDNNITHDIETAAISTVIIDKCADDEQDDCAVTSQVDAMCSCVLPYECMSVVTH